MLHSSCNYIRVRGVDTYISKSLERSLCPTHSTVILTPCKHYSWGTIPLLFMQCKWVVDTVPKINLLAMGFSCRRQIQVPVHQNSEGFVGRLQGNCSLPQSVRMMGNSRKKRLNCQWGKPAFSDSEGLHLLFWIFLLCQITYTLVQDACQHVKEIVPKYNDFHFSKIYCKQLIYLGNSNINLIC